MISASCDNNNHHLTFSDNIKKLNDINEKKNYIDFIKYNTKYNTYRKKNFFFSLYIVFCLLYN